jgi:DNA-binding MarR family transcriptional regulator
MNFTDYQVKTLVRENPGLNLYQLLGKAKEQMGRWPWTIGKIQQAVRRLENAGEVETESIVQGGRACVLVRCRCK